MGSLVWKMPEYVGHSLAEGTPKPLEHAFQPPTIGTEKIAVDQDRQRAGRSASAPDVISSWIGGQKEPAFASLCAHEVYLVRFNGRIQRPND
jgi:hypothetical protein